MANCARIAFPAFLLFLCATVVAQNAPASADQYRQLLDQWKKINSQAKEIVEKYQAAEASDRAPLRKQFDELVAQMEPLVPQLRAAAVAQYESGAKDEELTKLLVNLAQEDFANDRYEDALSIANSLIKNGDEVEGVYSVAGRAAFAMDAFADAEKYFVKARENDGLDEGARQDMSIVKDQREHFKKEQAIRAKERKANDLPLVQFETSKGAITLELFENEAPQTVGNFIHLVEEGFYDGLSFHRVLPNFMAQGGDPQGDGSGGPGYKIYCECHNADFRRHFRGTLSMAHASKKDTGGSQFFLTFRSTPHLDGRHTAFGRVVKGIDVLAKLTRRNPQALGQPEADKIVRARVLRKRDHEYQPTKVGESN